MANEIIITSDISCSVDKEVTGWAYVIQTENGCYRDTGLFEDFIRDSRHSEIYAMTLALKQAEELCSDWGSRSVIIYCEIINPLRMTRFNDDTNNLIAHSTLPVLSRLHSWQIKHVKAHYKAW